MVEYSELQAWLTLEANVQIGHVGCDKWTKYSCIARGFKAILGTWLRFKYLIIDSHFTNHMLTQSYLCVMCRINHMYYVLRHIQHFLSRYILKTNNRWFDVEIVLLLVLFNRGMLHVSEKSNWEPINWYYKINFSDQFASSPLDTSSFLSPQNAYWCGLI